MIYLNRLQRPPVELVEFPSKAYKIIEVGTFKLLNHMFGEINPRNPSIVHLVKPFFIIGIVRRMKVQNIFTDQYKLIDSSVHLKIDDFTLQHHYIVVDRIVPFADKLNDGVSHVIIGKKNLQVQRV